MKLHAFAVIAALAAPALASATPTDVPPPSSAPTDKAQPTGNGPNDKAQPTGDASKDMRGGKLGDADAKIISHLHHVNQMEIQLANLADKVGSPHVKDYAKAIVTDHQTADKDLTAFAKAHKIAAIPAEKPATDADRQDDKDMTAAMARIKTLKGAEFDKEYLNMMVSGHDKELTKIDVSISSVSDPDLKSMLQGIKPVLQRHADQARDLQKTSAQASSMEPNKLPSTAK